MKQKQLCCLLKGDKICSTCSTKVCAKHSVEGQSLSALLVGCTKAKCAARVKKAIASQVRDMKRMQKRTDGLHKIYHNFSSKFHLAKGETKGLTGYAAMEAIRKWSLRHPSVKMVRVDDSYHANSDLVFIPHETKKVYMGTTVVFIPQCTGEDPIEFFLYPGAVTKLQKVLKYLDRKKGKKY